MASATIRGPEAIPMNTSLPKAALPEQNQHADVPLCRLCGKPVPSETAKTNADGQAIHESCYRLKVQLEYASRDGHGKTMEFAAKERWVELCELASKEQDPTTLLKLTEEINQLLEAREQQQKAARSKPGVTNADAPPVDPLSSNSPSGEPSPATNDRRQTMLENPDQT